MSTRVVEVERLTRRYGERVALNEVSFTAEAGEIFGLLGPNGGGKTTLFRILSTELLPSAGAARVCGFDVTRQAHAARQRIGVVLQNQSVDGKLSVTENLRHQGHLYGLSGSLLRERIAAALARFNLTERAGERADKLSGGLRRRLEIAKATLHRPAVLLLDEPSTGLDANARRDLHAYLRDWREAEGVTIIWTTHILEEAENCDRLAILDEGRLVALATPAALKAEIGGDVVAAETRDPEALRARIRARFGSEPLVVGNTVRVERERGHEFITELVEAFPGEIDAVTMSRPTLEDVFIQRTGHRFAGRLEP